MFRPSFFGLAGRAALETGEGFACECVVCGRAVSAPHQFQGATVWCLYCGMERGIVPADELPRGLEFTSGISRAECGMAAENIHRLGEWATE